MKELKCERWGIWVKGVQEFFVLFLKLFLQVWLQNKMLGEKKNSLPPLSAWQFSCLQCCSGYFSITILHFLIKTPNILASNTKFCTKFHTYEGFASGSVVKNPPEMQETQVQSLGWEDLLEKEMATHSSILAWEIPRTEQPNRLQSTGLQQSWTWLRIKQWQHL